MKKFINIKTKEIKQFEEDVDIFSQPYLGRILNNDGTLMGHAHQNAYFDKDGNEYRPYYGKFLIKGSLRPLELNYSGNNKMGQR